jgi:hypothetical protein
MRSTRRTALASRVSAAAPAVILAASALVCEAETPEVAADSGLEELFRANSYVVELSDGELSGAGADFLLAEAEEVQFFCLGEPHNVSEIPKFVTALFERLQERLGFRYLAIEQGPFITNRIGTLAQTEGNDQVRQTFKKRRRALHFRTLEEVEMISDVARASEGTIPGVWGLDRVLDPSHLEEYLSSPAGSAAVDAEFLRNRASWSAENLSMYRSSRADGDGPSADQHREDGFKSGFRHYYRRATPEGGPPTRVLFRFGHVHMGRLAGKRYSSLGHYLSQFAEEKDLGSFHLNLQLINRPGHYWSLTDYPEFQPLARVGDPTKWVLVDLRPARAPLRTGELRANDQLVKLTFKFDAVLLMGGASKGRKL